MYAENSIPEANVCGVAFTSSSASYMAALDAHLRMRCKNARKYLSS
jgi:hypothetical protein